MKTKQEVIKEAWGDLFNALTNTQKRQVIQNDGFLKFFGEILHIKISNLSEVFEYIKGYGWRPKSLQGIENNNRWVSIKSEEDLPKGYIECYFITKYSYNTIFSGYFSFSDKTFYNNQNCYNINEITHYQPIIKPNKPLY